LAKKYIVVTGASTGIGRAAAVYLARQGFHVFAGVRRLADGDPLVDAAGGAPLTPLLMDVTDSQQIADAAAVIRCVVGEDGLAGLVNNAGVAVAMPLEFIPLGELRNQLEVNVVGQIGVTQALLPLLRLAKGRIINISSMAGRVAGPWTGPYHASKFALEALTDTLRQELMPWGIAVVSIEPGAVLTPIWQRSLTRARGLLAHSPPQLQKLYGLPLQQRIERAERHLDAGIPPAQVATVIHQALTTRHPQTRYQVGLDAKIAVRILARLPDRWRDWLIAKQR